MTGRSTALVTEFAVECYGLMANSENPELKFLMFATVCCFMLFVEAQITHPSEGEPMSKRFGLIFENNLMKCIWLI